MPSAQIRSSLFPKAPFLVVAALFCAMAVFVAALGIQPLGAAELLGIAACAAAAGVFAALPFVVDLVRGLDSRRALSPAGSPVDEAKLAAAVSAAVEARVAAALPELTAQIVSRLESLEEKRRAELQAALAATPARPVDADTVAAPAAAKPRLGRGLASLIHNPSALARPERAEEPRPADEPASPDHGSGDDRAAA